MHLDRQVPDSKERPVDSTLDGERRAERILAEYLRSWGLRDPSAIAEHCRRWVRQVTEDQGDRQGRDAAENPLGRKALAAAMSEMDEWVEHLALVVSPDPAEAASRSGLLAMELQRVIDKYPAALLEHESLPTSLVQKLQEAARLVVPVAVPRTQMHGPRLGELPPVFQLKKWRRFVTWTTTAIMAVVGYKRSRGPFPKKGRRQLGCGVF